MAFIFQLFHRLIPVQQNDIIFQLFIIGMVISKCIVTVWVYLRVICELGMDESIWNIWLVLWQKYIKAFQHWACHYMIPLNLPHPWPVTQHFTLSGFFFFTDCNLFLVWFKNVLFFQDWPSFSMLYFDHEDSWLQLSVNYNTWECLHPLFRCQKFRHGYCIFTKHQSQNKAPFPWEYYRVKGALSGLSCLSSECSLRAGEDKWQLFPDAFIWCRLSCTVIPTAERESQHPETVKSWTNRSIMQPVLSSCSLETITPDSWRVSIYGQISFLTVPPQSHRRSSDTNE